MHIHIYVIVCTCVCLDCVYVCELCVRTYKYYVSLCVLICMHMYACMYVYA